MLEKMKVIEDLSLNAWPSYQMQLYDGWLLRYSNFYTHRTNCVEQIGPSTIFWDEKLTYCEDIYHYWKTPTIYKITPLVPPLFDSFLEEHGYEKERVTDVMTLDLKKTFLGNPSVPIILEDYISSTWLEGFFCLKELSNPFHRKIVPQMYASIPKEIITARIEAEHRVVATGMGILDRDYVGIYAIHVDSTYRNQQWGRLIVSSLLNQGIKKGVSHAYLQVVSQNQVAKHLYTSLGFDKEYSYWFRIKNRQL